MSVLTELLKSNSERLSKRRIITDKHERLVLAGLASGSLLAFGYEAPQKMKDLPVTVPLHFLQGTVLWDKSEIRFEGIKLIAVRLIGKSQVAPETTPLSPPPRAGRPSRKDQAEKAFASLLADGTYNLNISLNHQFPMVRDRVKAMFPDEDQSDKGLGDKALYGFLSPLVAAAKV